MVMASCSFAYSYARVNITAFSVVQSRSGRMRPWAQASTPVCMVHKICTACHECSLCLPYTRMSAV